MIFLVVTDCAFHNSLTIMDSLLFKTKTLIGLLTSQVKEREELVNVLKLTPSANDNYDIINLLSKIVKNLKYLKEDLKSSLDPKHGDQFQALVTDYHKLTTSLNQDPNIDVLEYLFDFKPQAPVPQPTVKSVRFKDDEDEDNEDLRTQLMGTRSFKPYKDSIDSDEENNFNNHQLFAKHQQELLNQDEDLDVLHESVKLQKSMGLNINDEIENHLIILNDLERGVDNAGIKLTHTNNRLSDFRSRVQENGSLVTIIILSVILILLLVVLN